MNISTLRHFRPSKLARLTMVVAYQRALKRLREGLRCPSCHKALAVIESNTPPVLLMRCPVCGHLWQAEAPGTKKH